MDLDLSVKRIEEAARTIDPAIRSVSTPRSPFQSTAIVTSCSFGPEPPNRASA